MRPRLTTSLSHLRVGDSFFSLQRSRARACYELAQAHRQGARKLFSYHFVDIFQGKHQQCSSCPVEKLTLLKKFYETDLSALDKLQEIGITGTNGKTSVAHILQQALKCSGQNWVVVGTLGLTFPGQMATYKLGLTTPDIIDYWWVKKIAIEQGYQGLISEVSSHSLEQRRNYGCNYQAVLITSVSGDDHLDYHGSIYRYFLAKSKIFNNFASQVTIMHHDNPLQAFIDYDRINTRIVRVAHTKIFEKQDLKYAFHRQHLDLVEAYLRVFYLTPSKPIQKWLEHPGLLGRAQQFSWCQQRQIIVDYAHTPKALEFVSEILKTLYPNAPLWIMFGCGGDRDRMKRPQMLSCAVQFADKVIITEDNNRTEPFKTIVDDMLASAGPEHLSKIIIEPYRPLAWKLLYDNLPQGGIALAAGKGAEFYTGLSKNVSLNTDLKQVKSYELL